MIEDAVICRSSADLLEHYRAQVQGTSIGAITLLSTDYFNLFNEVIMLLDLVPDLAEEVDAWRFKSYVEHFEESGLHFAPLAIEAYRHAPEDARDDFDRTVSMMRMLVEDIQEVLREDLAAGRDVAAQAKAAECSAELRRLVSVGSAIANGTEANLGQADIDRLF